MQIMEQFFFEWDLLEHSHPWGVNTLSPFLSGFAISSAMCEEVDCLLFVDLMTQNRPDYRYIKVEGRFSCVVFWVLVIIRHPMVIVGFVDNPIAPVQRSLVVAATPSLIIACILAFFHWAVNTKTRCGRIDMQAAAAKYARVH